MSTPTRWWPRPKARGSAIMSVGRKGPAFVSSNAAIDGFAQTLRLEHGGKNFQVRLPLVGEFQIENALVAAGLAIATGSEPAAVFAALEHLTGAKGRLERVGTSRGAPIFVDYAHKPDALAKALEALRPYVTGRLVVVFGAGGDRDRGKRPLMGADRRRKGRPRDRHRRQSAQRGCRRDPRRDPGGGARRRRNRRPRARRSAPPLPICAPATSC